MENPVHELRRTLERERHGTTSPDPVRRPHGPQLISMVMALGAVVAFMILRPRAEKHARTDDADPLFQQF